jgi:hypothetical protein
MVAALVVMLVAAFVVVWVGPPEGGILASVAMLIGALVMVSFVSLTVEVDSSTLTCRFGPGFVRKRIPVADIVQATPVTNPWYIGWGIRWYPGRCWVWNVSGLQAVELDMKSGRKFRIGTDEPTALVEAIRTARSMPGFR